jgi:hypothetical protein
MECGSWPTVPSINDTRVLNHPRRTTALADFVFCRSHLYELWRNSPFNYYFSANKTCYQIICSVDPEAQSRFI